MKVGQFLKIMAVVTFMAVLYINLQMKIYSLAYQGRVREIKLEKLAENNVMVRNDILRLQSSDHIGRQLLAKEKSYSFAGKNHVVEVEERAAGWNDALSLKKGGEALGRMMTLAFTPNEPAIAR